LYERERKVRSLASGEVGEAGSGKSWRGKGDAGESWEAGRQFDGGNGRRAATG
jgi:hypothetical protein